MRILNPISMCVGVFMMYLQYDLFWSLIGLQEVAYIDKGPLLTSTIFTFEVIPPKFYEFLSMMNKVSLKILEK